MKKEVFIFLSVLSLLLITFGINAENKSAITGSTVTGDITNMLVLNITISEPPTLAILHPRNQTYITSQNLNLNFTVSDEEWVKYSLDSEANITITGNIKFNTTEGSHSLFLYANNTNGLTMKNVTFFVNSNKIAVPYNEYLGSKKGSSTDFNSTSYEDSQNLSGVILENAEYGKINFNDNLINLTDDSDFSDNVVNLDTNTNLSFNRIEINSTSLPNFNKSATLTLYNLTLTNPRILRDGSVCSSNICTEGPYSGGTFVFNVTSFTTYTIEETPSDSQDSGSPGGGGSSGGGGGIISKIFPIKKGISVSTENIKVSLKPGEVNSQTFVITNQDTKKLRINIENPKLKDFIIIRNPVFDLAPGESKEIAIDIIARQDTVPNLYLGKILVKTEFEEKEILVVINVESLGALLDVRTKIQEDYLKILPGDELLAEISLFNLGAEGRADITIEYIIKNYEGNEISVGQESLAIETQANFLRKIIIPQDTGYGKYALYVRVEYNGEIASASDNFEIVQYKVSDIEKIYIVIIVLLVIILAMFAYYKLQEKIASSKKIVRKVEIKNLIKR